MASSLGQALEQRGLGSYLLVEAPRRVLIVVLTAFTHPPPHAMEHLLRATRALLPPKTFWGSQQQPTGVLSPVALVAAVGFSRSRGRLTQCAHVWQNPTLDGSTAQALVAVATAGCGVAMAFSIFTIAFCVCLR